MIPYFEFTSFQIGPFTIYVWGLLVALGFLAGLYVASQRSKRMGLNNKVIYDLGFILIASGFLGGRFGYILFYDLSTFIQNPFQIIKVWDGGMSVYGGFIFATIAGVIYLKYKKLSIIDYSDTMVFGLPFGLFIGRLGCFLIHDHPGTETGFFLGVKYPDEIIRHDHGLYLSINGFILFFIFLWISKRPRPVGTYIALFLLWYGVVRFFLDFTRVIDVRYAGLTPAQYFSIIFAGFGLIYLIKLFNNYGRNEK